MGDTAPVFLDGETGSPVNCVFYDRGIFFDQKLPGKREVTVRNAEMPATMKLQTRAETCKLGDNGVTSVAMISVNRKVCLILTFYWTFSLGSAISGGRAGVLRRRR